MTHAIPNHVAFHAHASGWSWPGIAVVIAVHSLLIGLLATLDVVPVPSAVATLLVRPIAPEPLPMPSPQPRPRPVEPHAVKRPNPAPAAVPAVLSAPAAAAEPATAALPVKAPSPVSQPVATLTPPQFDAAYLNNPPPAYPPVSRRLREEGRVMLYVRVLPDGQPDEIEIQVSSGSPRLDQAARETVRRWRFVPARQSGEALAAWVRVPIAFTLKD